MPPVFGLTRWSDLHIRHASVDAADGAVEEVTRIVGQIRSRWPKVRIVLRADSGFARDQLMRDAADPQAPDSLRQDARTVLKWFGVVKPDAVETKHRLQFARAFERYLMEGHAPSGALAPSFATLSKSLTEIYGTPQALNVALNDDIRGVFNRLLATPSA
jgi:hypothetical protein